jgi:hypothetical protein
MFLGISQCNVGCRLYFIAKNKKGENDWINPQERFENSIFSLLD